MYTNINKDSTHVILKSIFESLELTNGKVDALLQAVNLANNHNYVEFDGHYFRQEKGLAMGTACSPDIANLYLGNGEHNRKIPFCKGILSYG
jgi:glycine/serine hydroxymethyltransferase